MIRLGIVAAVLVGLYAGWTILSPIYTL